MKTKNFNDLFNINSEVKEYSDFMRNITGTLLKQMTADGVTPYEDGKWKSIENKFKLDNGAEIDFWSLEETQNTDKIWDIANNSNYTKAKVSNRTFSLIIWSLTLSTFTYSMQEQMNFLGKDDLLLEVNLLHENLSNFIHLMIEDEEELEKFIKLTS